MKLIRIITAIALVVSSLVLTVGAAEATPSVELGEGIQLIETTDEDGNRVVATINDENGDLVRKVLWGELIVTPISSAYNDSIELDADIEKTLLDTEAELDAKPLSEFLAAFEAEWKAATEGAPLENSVVAEIFDARLVGDVATYLEGANTITFSLKLDSITAEDAYLLLHKYSAWENIKCEMSDDGVITITVDSLSPFAVITDTEKAPVVEPDAPDSPQTGVAEYSVLAAIGAVLFTALAVVFAKKARAAR